MGSDYTSEEQTLLEEVVCDLGGRCNDLFVLASGAHLYCKRGKRHSGMCLSQYGGVEWWKEMPHQAQST
jgi:hypothetical protein